MAVQVQMHEIDFKATVRHLEKCHSYSMHLENDAVDLVFYSDTLHELKSIANSILEAVGRREAMQADKIVGDVSILQDYIEAKEL